MPEIEAGVDPTCGHDTCTCSRELAVWWAGTGCGGSCVRRHGNGVADGRAARQRCVHDGLVNTAQGCRAHRKARERGGHSAPPRSRDVVRSASQGSAAGTRAGLVNTAQGFRAHRKARQRGGYGLSYGGQGAPAGVAADPVACGVDSVADGRSGEETGHRMALWFGLSTTEWMDCQNFPPGNKPMPSRHQTFLARNNLRNGLFLGQTSTFSENIAR